MSLVHARLTVNLNDQKTETRKKQKASKHLSSSSNCAQPRAPVVPIAAPGFAVG
jgi:hypothetical protein